MGFQSFLRSLAGAASSAEVDAVVRAGESARDARATLDEVRALATETREECEATLVAARDELSRLSARVEAMPEMRAQLEQFVQSLGRTMTQAVERLDSVDDRLHAMEQQMRAQTEVIGLTRSELDRQGRALAALEPRMQALDHAATRLASATDRVDATVREFEASARRTYRIERVAIAAVVVALITLGVVLVRGG
jgi:chromosome segregation ATPase